MELNVIYNEDCYEGIKKIPSKSIDLVYIDPPYDMETRGGGFHDIRDYYDLIQDEGMADGISKALLDELCRVMKKINIYIYCSKNQLRQLFDYFDDKNCNIDLLVWHKTNPIPTVNNKYLSDLEYILFIRDKGVKCYTTYETGSKLYQSTVNKNDKDLYGHPTIKPLEMVKTHILNSTQENEVVLDCFMGSGTTAVACKELGRNYIGFEINPKYYQIAIDRVNGITQKDRKLKESGIMDIFDFGVNE